MIKQTTDALLRRVEARREALVDFAAGLIRIPTVNPPGENYRDCCEAVARRVMASGFATQFLRAEGFPGDTDAFPRWNLLARRAGARPGPVVHFNGHIDVVETGAGWTVEPFGGAVVDGRLYGRGSADMKGGLAAAIIAIEAFIETHPDHPGAIEISATADEESGGYGGVAFLAERGLISRERIDHVIIPEPLDKDRICLGHRGVWWAEVETEGRIAHGSMPFLGDSAIRHMGALLERMERDLYPKLDRRFTAMPVVPEGARRSTLNVNAIHGGQPEGHAGFPSPCVADSCRIVLDRRFLAEEPIGEVKAEIRRLLDDLASERPGFRYAMRDIFEVLPSMTDRGAPVARALAGAIGEVVGREPAYVVSPGTYDQKHFNRIAGISDCVAYGPGILSLAHQPDEYVGIDDMVDAAKVMALALRSLLMG
jgi:succinyl-diaminopimelate desuccinylase